VVILAIPIATIPSAVIFVKIANGKNACGENARPEIVAGVVDAATAQPVVKLWYGA
jgi:hypothetical protein